MTTPDPSSHIAPPPPSSPGRALRLEPDDAEMARLLDRLSRLVRDEIAGLDGAPAAGPIGAAGRGVAEAVSRAIPEEPLAGGIEAVVALLGAASRASLTANGPGYMAYIPGGGLFAAALADLAADVLNRYTGMTAPAPALGRLEQDVLAWLGREFGYDARARGLLTAGGSTANLAAVVAARHAVFGEDTDYRAAVVYASSQAHHSVRKAVRLAGLPEQQVRLVAVDEAYRLRPDALDEAIAADRRAGLRPVMVIAAAGTTNTGAIDPLGALADRCARERLWLHVDAAYGGAFVLCEEGRRRLAGIERADSIVFDPHKGMFLPYGTGCVLVRDGAALERAHRMEASYLQDFDLATGGEVSWSPADLGPDLSRDFRGLRLWLPLMLHGAGAFRDALAEKLALAEHVAAGLDALIADGAPIEMVARPALSLVAFRLARRAGESMAAWNARNARWLDRINARGRVHLSSTKLPIGRGGDGERGIDDDGGVFTLRVCVLSVRTHAEHVERALEDIRAALGEITMSG